MNNKKRQYQDYFNKRLNPKPIKLKSFKKDKIASILADFSSTELYEEGFLKDLEEGLKKSSVNE